MPPTLKISPIALLAEDTTENVLIQTWVILMCPRHRVKNSICQKNLTDIVCCLSNSVKSMYKHFYVIQSYFKLISFFKAPLKLLYWRHILMCVTTWFSESSPHFYRVENYKYSKLIYSTHIAVGRSVIPTQPMTLRSRVPLPIIHLMWYISSCVHVASPVLPKHSP